jgi:hypothetical protein
VVIGIRSDKSQKFHKFDLVSNDEGIIGEIKSSKFSNETTGKAGYTTTRKARLIEALFYLSRVKAHTKLLILTDKDLFEQFKKDMDGLLSADIKIIHVNVT